MARSRKEAEEVKITRPARVKLSREESLKRMEEFPERRAEFIASIRRNEHVQDVKIARPARIKLSEEECLERMVDFPKRRAQFIASVRKSKDRLPSTD